MPRTLTLLLLIGGVALLLPGSAGAQEGGWYYIWHAVPPAGSPGAGWVKVEVLLTPSGCRGCQCGGSWAPNTADSLMERPTDRATLAHGEPGNRAPAWDPRAVCPPGTALHGERTAGTWYHNAHFDVICLPLGCDYDYQHMTADCEALCQWGALRNAGWVFIEADNCCPGGVCAPEPGPGPCPAAEWRYSPITANNWRVQPSHPVVVGQDPRRLGVAVLFDLTLPPATRIWYEHVPCPPPPTPEPGVTPTPAPPCEPCVRHVTTVRDSISTADATLQLQAASRRWIQQELAARYPNAAVRRPTMSQSATLQGCYYTGATHHCTAVVPFAPEDPGYYTLTAGARANLGGGRSFRFTGDDVLVYLKDSTLVPE